MAIYGNGQRLLNIPGGNANSSYRLDATNAQFQGNDTDLSNGTLECTDFSCETGSDIIMNDAEVIIRNGSTNLSANNIGAIYGDTFTARNLRVTFAENNGETKLFGGTSVNGTCVYDLEDVVVRRINGGTSVALAQVQNALPGSRFVRVSSGALTIGAGTLWEDTNLDGIRSRGDAGANFVTFRHSNQPSTGASIVVFAHWDLTLATPFAAGSVTSTEQSAADLQARLTVGKMQSRFNDAGARRFQMNIVNPVNELVPFGRRRSTPVGPQTSTGVTGAVSMPGFPRNTIQNGDGIRSWQYWNPVFTDNLGQAVTDITFNLNGDSVYLAPTTANLLIGGGHTGWEATPTDKAYSHTTGNGLLIWRYTMNTFDDDDDTGLNGVDSRRISDILRSAPTTTQWGYRSRTSSLTPYSEAGGTINPGVSGFGFGPAVGAASFANAGVYTGRGKTRGGIDYTAENAVPVFADPIIGLAENTATMTPATIEFADTLNRITMRSINDMWASLVDLYNRNTEVRDFTLNGGVFTIPRRVDITSAGTQTLAPTTIGLGINNASIISATPQISVVQFVDGSDLSEGNWQSTLARPLTIRGNVLLTPSVELTSFNTLTGTATTNGMDIVANNTFGDVVSGVDTNITGDGNTFDSTLTLTGASSIANSGSYTGAVNITGPVGDNNTFVSSLIATGNVGSGNSAATIQAGGNLGSNNISVGDATIGGTIGSGNGLGNTTAGGNITVGTGATNNFLSLTLTAGDLSGTTDTTRNIIANNCEVTTGNVIDFNTVGGTLMVPVGSLGNNNNITGDATIFRGVGNNNTFVADVTSISMGDGNTCGTAIEDRASVGGNVGDGNRFQIIETRNDGNIGNGNIAAGRMVSTGTIGNLNQGSRIAADGSIGDNNISIATMQTSDSDANIGDGNTASNFLGAANLGNGNTTTSLTDISSIQGTVGSGNTIIGTLNASGNVTIGSTGASNNLNVLDIFGFGNLSGFSDTARNITTGDCRVRNGNVLDFNTIGGNLLVNNGSIGSNNNLSGTVNATSMGDNNNQSGAEATDLARITGNIGNGNSFQVVQTVGGNIGNNNSAVSNMNIDGTVGFGNIVGGLLTSSGNITIPTGGTTNTFGRLELRGDLIGLNDGARNVITGDAMLPTGNVIDFNTVGGDLTVTAGTLGNNNNITGHSAIFGLAGNSNSFVNGINAEGAGDGNNSGALMSLGASGLGNNNGSSTNRVHSVTTTRGGNIGNGNFVENFTVSDGTIGDNNDLLGAATAAGLVGDGNTFGNNINGEGIGNNNIAIGNVTVGAGGIGNNNGTLAIPLRRAFVLASGNVGNNNFFNFNCEISGNLGNQNRFNRVLQINGNVGNENTIGTGLMIDGGSTIGDNNTFSGPSNHSAGDGSTIGDNNTFNGPYDRAVTGNVNYVLGDGNRFFGGSNFAGDEAIGGLWSNNVFIGTGPALTSNVADTNIDGPFTAGNGNEFVGTTLIEGTGAQVMGDDTVFTAGALDVRLRSAITFGNDFEVNVADDGQFRSEALLTTGERANISATGTGTIGLNDTVLGTGAIIASATRTAINNLTLSGAARTNGEVGILNNLVLNGNDNRLEGGPLTVGGTITDTGGEHRLELLTSTGRVTVNNDSRFLRGCSFIGGLTCGTGTFFESIENVGSSFTSFGAATTIGNGATIGGFFLGTNVSVLGANATFLDGAFVELEHDSIRPNLNVGTGSTLVLCTTEVALNWNTINLDTMIGSAIIQRPDSQTQDLAITIPDTQLSKVVGLAEMPDAVVGQTVTLRRISYVITGDIVTRTIRPNVSEEFLQSNGGYWNIHDYETGLDVVARIDINSTTTLADVTHSVVSSSIRAMWIARYLPNTDLADLGAMTGIWNMSRVPVRSDSDTLVTPIRAGAGATVNAQALPTNSNITTELIGARNDSRILQIGINSAVQLSDAQTQGGVYIAAKNSAEYFDLHIDRNLIAESFVPSVNSGAFTNAQFISIRPAVSFDPDGTGPMASLQVIPSVVVGQYDGPIPTIDQFGRPDVFSIPDTQLSGTNTSILLSGLLGTGIGTAIADVFAGDNAPEIAVDNTPILAAIDAARGPVQTGETERPTIADALGGGSGGGITLAQLESETDEIKSNQVVLNNKIDDASLLIPTTGVLPFLPPVSGSGMEAGLIDFTQSVGVDGTARFISGATTYQALTQDGDNELLPNLLIVSIPSGVNYDTGDLVSAFINGVRLENLVVNFAPTTLSILPGGLVAEIILSEAQVDAISGAGDDIGDAGGIDLQYFTADQVNIFLSARLPLLQMTEAPEAPMPEMQRILVPDTSMDLGIDGLASRVADGVTYKAAVTDTASLGTQDFLLLSTPTGSLIQSQDLVSVIIAGLTIEGAEVVVTGATAPQLVGGPLIVIRLTEAQVDTLHILGTDLGDDVAEVIDKTYFTANQVQLYASATVPLI